MSITQCTSNYIAIAVLEVIYVDENLRERVYVSYGDFIVSSILNESKAADDVFKPHWHDAFEVLQIYDREIHIEYEGERFTAVPGDMVVFGANAVHAGRTGENGCYYRALQFKWNELLGNTPFEQKMLHDLLDGTYHFEARFRDAEANRLFDAVVQAHDAKGLVQPIAEKGQLCLFVSYLMQQHMSSTYFFSSTDDRFSALLDYIKQHFTEDITTDQLAERFSYSKSHLCRKFKRNLGLPITDYIHMCRIEYAQHLIKKDRLELTEIAAACGYNSYSYFSRKFRQFATVAPIEWRSRFVSTNYLNK